MVNCAETVRLEFTDEKYAFYPKETASVTDLGDLGCCKRSELPAKGLELHFAGTLGGNLGMLVIQAALNSSGMTSANPHSILTTT